MKIYMAIVRHTIISKVVNDLQYPNILNSFAYNNALDDLTFVPPELTLDSGAFTAWNAGKEVNIDEYKKWALEMSMITPNVRCVNLDVIPGEAGRSSTKAERIEGMKQSIENADYLRAAGLNIMEVFHQDEPFEFLDLLLDRLPSKDSVLCISPRNDVSTKAKIIWHNQVLKHLVSRFGIDNLPKTHGLAVTSKRLLLAFPYFSTDSSSYASPLRYGTLQDHDGNTVRYEDFMGHNFGGDDTYGAASIVIRQSIARYQTLEQQVTSVWKARGVSWE